MNRKTLILLAMASTLAIPSGCYAASNITGVTGSNGVYNISADFIGKNGGSGFKKYDNFTVGAGDTANLMFDGYTKNGEAASINTFINLVKNPVNINGVVNTMKSTGFYNGHAVFITPGGMVVGSSGVLNVGRLSTVTPNTTKFNEMGDAYDAYMADKTQANANAFVNTGVMNFLSNSKTGGTWGSNGDITVEAGGRILARDGVVLRGANVNVAGAVVNGVTTNQAYAANLFDSLVNTAGIKAATAKTTGGQLVIEGAQGVTVTGNILNNDNGGTYVTNNGTNGLNVSGEVFAKGGTARLYSTNGDLNVGTDAAAKIGGSEVQVLNNQGLALTLGKDATIDANVTKIYNNGTEGLVTDATINTTTLSMKNQKGKNSEGVGMKVGGTITGGGDVAIKNYDGDMTYTASVTNNGFNTGIVNYAGAMNLGGSVANNGNTGIINIKQAGTGAMNVTGTVTNTAATGHSSAKVHNTTTYITNRTGSGMTYSGTANVSNGDLAINNYNGAMTVNGKIDVKNANLGIVDRTGGGAMNVASDVTVAGGNAVMKKEAGTTGDMTVNGTITHDGYMAVLNNAGELNLGATVTNNGGAVKDASGNLAGGFYAISRTNGTGVNVTKDFNITGNGEVLIKNKTGANGLNYAQGATINTSGYQAALVNRKGNLNAAGDITADHIIVRAGTQADPSTGTFTVTGNLKPTGTTSPSYIVNWYTGEENAVNGDSKNGVMYSDGVEIRQQEVK